MGVKHLLKVGAGLVGILLLLWGCFPPLPPEAEQPPAPGVVVSPEGHRGRAQIFALENYPQLLLLERSARKRNHQLVFDRKGIRFEEQGAEVVLAISGRYFWKFDADKSTPAAEAEELWRAVMGPLLEEIFVRGRLKLGFDRVRVEIRFERASPSSKGLTEQGAVLFDVKAYRPEEGPRPKDAQIFLSRTQAKIDGKVVVLREKS